MAQPVVVRLEAAVGACDSMKERAQVAKGLVPDLLARSNELAETLESSGQATREAIASATAVVGETRSRLEASVAEARTNLQALAAAAQALAEESATLLGELRSELAEIAAARDALTAALQSGIDATQAECAEIAGRVEAIEAESSAAASAVMERIAALRAAVDQTRESLGREQQGWGEAIAALHSASETESQDFDTRAMAFVQEFGTIVNDAAEGVVDDHNAALQSTWDGFVERTTDELVTALDAAGQSLAAGDEACGEQGRALQASGRLVGELVQGLAEVLSDLGSRASDAAARLPG